MRPELALLLFLTLSLSSCDGRSEIGNVHANSDEPPSRSTEHEESSIDREFLDRKRQILEEMAHYMKFGGAEDENDPWYDEDFNAGYSQSDIDECDRILTAFLKEVAELRVPPDGEEVLRSVKSTVLALNRLNERCGGNLIETDQREEFVPLITTAAERVGLRTDDDLTFEWRKW